MANPNPTPYGEKETVILGIDPGTNVLGYGVLKVTAGRPKMEAMGVIDLHRCASPYLKLGRIYERVVGVIKCKNPRCITSVEQELVHEFKLTDPAKKVYRCIYCEQAASSGSV